MEVLCEKFVLKKKKKMFVIKIVIPRKRDCGTCMLFHSIAEFVFVSCVNLLFTTHTVRVNIFLSYGSSVDSRSLDGETCVQCLLLKDRFYRFSFRASDSSPATDWY